MFPLRLSLFALIFLAVLGMSQEAEAAAPTIELLTPHEGSYVPFTDWDNEDIYFTWNSTDTDGDALVHKVYFGTDKDDLDQIGSTTDEVLKYTTDISYNTTYYWKASANDGGGEVFSSVWNFTVFETGDRVQWHSNEDDDYRYHGIGVDKSRKTILACGTYYVSIFEFNNENPIWHYEASNNDEVFDCDFSQEDYFVFGMSYSGQADGYGVELYHIDDANEVEQIWKYETEYVVRYTQISDDGENIAVGLDENLVSYFSKDSSTPLWTTDLDSHESMHGPDILLSHDKEFVIAHIADKIYSLDTDDGNINWTYDIGGDYEFKEMALSSKNDLVVMTLWEDYTNSSTLYFVNNSDTPLWNFTQANEYEPRDVQFSVDGNHVVTCLESRTSEEGIVRLFSNRNSTPSLIIDDSSNALSKCSISDNGDYLAYFTGLTGGDEDEAPAFLISVKRNVTLEEFGANTPSGGAPSLRKAMFTEDGAYLLYIGNPYKGQPLYVSQNFIPFVFIDSESVVLINEIQSFSGIIQYSKNNVTDFAWNVDGTEINDVLSVSHTFTEEGTYQITFSAKDHYGHNSSVFTKEILAVRQPTIEITNNPARYVNEGDHIFNCVADVYGTIQTYEWISSIDGTLSTQKSFVTQLSNGTHNISVRVQDNYGFWSEYDYVDVKVSGLPWISDMSMSPNPAELDEEVSFSSSSYIYEGSVTGWTWTSSLDGALSSSESFTDATLSLGTHTISLVLESDTGNTSQTFTKTLIVQNTPPVINTDEMSIFPSEGVYNETTFDFVGKATDFHSLTYEWSSNLNGVLSTSAEFSTGDLTVGYHDLTFKATDEYDESSSYTYSSGIWVKSRPTVFIVSNAVTPEDTDILFNALSVDADGTIDDYRWFVNGQEASEESSFFTTSFPEPGVHNVSLIIEDNDGLTQTSFVTVTVLDVPDVEVNFETSFQEGEGFVDGGADARISRNIASNVNSFRIHINITGESSSPLVQSDITVSISGPSGTEFTESYSLSAGDEQYIQFSKDSGQMVGDWELKLESNDPASDFSLNYQWYANYPPALIGDQNSLTLTATVKDTDSLSHTFTWISSLDGDLGTTNPVTISSLSPGEHTITVTATDDDEMEGSYSFSVNVGQSPTIESVSIPDTATLIDGLLLKASIILDCVAVDDSDLSYLWEITVPSGDTITRGPYDECYHDITFYEFPKQVIVNLTVTNQLGFTSTYSKMVDFQIPPTVTISPSTKTLVESGAEILLNGSAEDGDGNDTIVSYTWESDLDGVLSLKQSTTTSLSVGTHEISFKAVDNDGMVSRPATITIVVYEPLVIFLSDDIEVDIDEAVLFSPTSSHPGNISKYEWDFNGDGVFDWSSTTTGETTYKYDEKGVYEAKLQITDNYGTTSNSTRTIAVATELPQPEPEVSNPLGDSDSTLLIVAAIIGASIVGAAVVMSRKKTQDPYPQSYPEPTPKAKEPEKKAFTPKKKKVMKSFVPKAELVAIECPGCDAQMKVPKLNELQEVTCSACGLSGEIEI